MANIYIVLIMVHKVPHFQGVAAFDFGSEGRGEAYSSSMASLVAC